MDPVAAFIEAACVPLDGGGHGEGDVGGANAVLAAHPELAKANVFVAAALGDDAAVRGFLAAAPAAATEKGGPRGWDPLTYLCFSRYLRLDTARSDGFVRAARALLDAGANPNTGFTHALEKPGEEELGSVLYGAAAIARHLEVTRALLEHGADPNDGETPYHLPEGYQNDVMELVVESGRMSEQSLATMLARKHDWHDYEGIAWLLEHGADPNTLTAWGRRALHQAIERDNPLRFFELLLDHKADPRLANKRGKSAIVVAARAGRGDVLELFARRGFTEAFEGVDALLAACAYADETAARALATPELVRAAEAEVPGALADAAGSGNAKSVDLMLSLGFAASSSTSLAGARADTALHAAIWRGRTETVKLLVARGASLEATNGRGETPLVYAVRACLGSEWTYSDAKRKSGALDTAIVETLLAAGADRGKLALPTGYAPLDLLLKVRQ